MLVVERSKTLAHWLHNKMRKRTKIVMLLALFGMGCMLHNAKAEAENQTALCAMQPEIAGKILRFHILANSDADEDQTLKLKVRDAIGGYIETYLEGCNSLEESKAEIQKRIPEIEQVGAACMAKEGYDYSIHAELKRASFPVKTYDDFTFPEGEYEALQVVIGEGEGHNWWCVLYPNLCFRGSVYKVEEKANNKANYMAEDKTKEKLRKVLSPEEYKAVIRGGKYKVRLKILDYFKQTR